MLENELESIFSAGKVAMKSIFKEDDSSQSENKIGILDDASDKVISQERIICLEAAKC